MRTISVLLVMMLSASVAQSQELPWTVADAVRAALDHHPASIQANAVLDEATGEWRAHLSLESPALSIEYEGVPEGSGLSAYEERRLGLSQEFDFPLRFIWHTRQQNAFVDAATHQQRGILIELEAEVRRAYLDAWLAGKQQSVFEQYAASLDTQAVSFRRMLDVGRVADLDHSRAQAEAVEARVELYLTRAEWEAAKNRLAKLTDIESLPDALASPLEISWSEPNIQEPWLTNPELNTTEYLAQAADEEKTLSATSWLPRIEVGGFRQYVPDATQESDFWGMEVGLSVPLWYLWGGLGDVQAASARQRDVHAQVDRLRLDLESEWQAAIKKLKAEQNLLATYEETLLPTSKTIERLARRSYDAGKVSYLDVLEAQRSLLQRRLGHLDIIYDLESTRITLDRLTGRSILNTNIDPMER